MRLANPRRSRRSLGDKPYQPALDGVRAVSVVAVLLFHAGFSWMTGGYLGVSVFFTLSGFLITRLLVDEHERSGRIDLGTFYSRRARRLLPASAVCLLGICLFAAAGTFDGVANLRRDVLGAALQIANWTSLAGHGGYTEQLAAEAGQRSPLTHYWSLAIEEQFYWLWPLAMFVLMRWARRAPSHRKRLVWAIGALTVAFGVSAPVIARLWGARAAYWATPARVPEILVGALVAVAIGAFPALLRPRRLLVAIGIACLTAIVAACALAPSGSGFAYDGALPVFALLSGGLLLSLQVQGPLTAALSAEPLAWLGRISYGVYLYHWPVYVLLDERRTGIDSTWGLLALRLAVTMGVAVVSFYAIEQPIRHGAVRPLRVAQVAAIATAAVAVSAIVLVPEPRGDYYAVAQPPVAETVALGVTLAPLVPSTTSTTRAPAVTGVPATMPATAAPATTSPPTTVVVPPRPVRIMMIGDSTAEATASGLIAWASAHPELAVVSLSVERGCGFLPDGDVWEADRWRPIDTRCNDWLDAGIGDAVEAFQPDVTVLMTTSWDVLDRRWPGTDARTPADQGYRDRLVVAMQRTTDHLLDRGVAEVAWIRHPIGFPYWFTDTDQSDPNRHAPLYDEMQALATARPSQVGVLDMAGWVDARGWSTDQQVRPDGVHWTPEASTAMAEEWLGPQLLALALQPSSGN